MRVWGSWHGIRPARTQNSDRPNGPRVSWSSTDLDYTAGKPLAHPPWFLAGPFECHGSWPYFRILVSSRLTLDPYRQGFGNEPQRDISIYINNTTACTQSLLSNMKMTPTERNTDVPFGYSLFLPPSRTRIPTHMMYIYI